MMASVFKNKKQTNVKHEDTRGDLRFEHGDQD